MLELMLDRKGDPNKDRNVESEQPQKAASGKSLSGAVPVGS